MLVEALSNKCLSLSHLTLSDTICCVKLQNELRSSIMFFCTLALLFSFDFLALGLRINFLFLPIWFYRAFHKKPMSSFSIFLWVILTLSPLRICSFFVWNWDVFFVCGCSKLKHVYFFPGDFNEQCSLQDAVACLLVHAQHPCEVIVW